MPKRVLAFIKKEVVLSVSFLAALISSFFVPPDAAWAGYIDWRTLALLYCLMVVVAGLRKAGTFARLAHVLCRRTGTVRALSTVLIALSFFSSMFITNDVALLTFVPFAVAVLGMANETRSLTLVVVLQAAAANLGSMLLPVGNPQNLYIHSHFSLSLNEFLRTTLPVWLVSLVLIALLCLLIPRRKTEVFLGEMPILHKRSLAVYLALFAVCLMVVFRLIVWPIMLAVILLVLAFYDRSILKSADFMLLLTFVCFFVFAGNMARIEAVNTLLRTILSGHEFWVTLLLSQVISNVPATLLLSGFTDAAHALLLGADIGGLGTPIASLASLIALRLYSHAEGSRTGHFLAVFTLVNLGLLIVLAILFH